MDVAEFTIKAGFKILEFSFIFNKEISEKGKSFIWEDVYILSEAIKVVNDEITDSTCISNIISALDLKYELEAVEAPSTGGIGEMTIDPPTDCNVFTIYE